MEQLGDPFWADDFSILYDSNRFTHFFPSESMTMNEKMNAIVRFTVYASILLVIYKKKFKYVNLVLLACIFTYLVMKNQSDASIKVQQDYTEHLINGIDNGNFKSFRDGQLTHSDKTRVPPTEGNPFGNVTFVDHLDNPNRGPAMDISDPNVKQQVDTHFNKTLYNDVTDVFGKVNSQRQFYTMPVTEIPNDRESFQNWLFADGLAGSGINGKTCKEDQNACYRYNDPRQQQQMLVNKYTNPV